MGKYDNIFIVSDIDNTFLAKDRSVPQRNLDALEYFKNEGGLFTFATGRSHFSLLHAFPNAAELLNGPAILGNGSYLYDYAKDQLISPVYIDKILALQVAHYVLDIYPDTGMRILTPETTIYSCVNKYIEKELEQGWYKNISTHQDTKDWTGEHWCKIVIRDDPDKLDYMRILIGSKFDQSKIEMVKSENDFLEIQAKGCNKGRGIEILRSNYLKSDKKVTFYACGDYENDIPMMKVADIATCPLNASDEVKAIADLVLCDCNDGTIAKLIETL